MLRNEGEAVSGSGTIELRTILSALWVGKWLLVATTAICLLLGIGYLHMVRPEYTTVLKVVPVGGGNGGLDSRFGGIASLAGISLPRGSQEAQFELFLEGLKSREVAVRISREHHLMVEMFPNEWDEKNKSWKSPTSAFRGVTKRIKTFLGIPVQSWQRPNPQRIQEYLDRKIRISEDRDSSVVTVRLESSNPAFSEKLLSELALHSDEYCRQRLIQRTGDYISYLEQKLRTVTIEEHRSALVQIMSDQEKQRMMAASQLPFSADMFGTPTTSRQPSSPKAMLVLLASFVIGSFIGALIIIMRFEQP